MIYIRTKDGKIWSNSNSNNNFLYAGSDRSNGKWLHEIGCVFKSANTVEEVCDNFVFAFKNDVTRKYLCWKFAADDIYFVENDKGGSSFDLHSKESADRILNDYDVYGGIWTSEGFIYKAKLIRKGEWQLI